MEQGKTHNSDTSTAESDHNNARSYDCGFCKRGFTNAQALGGHMNIHRKDKAKAEKKKNQEADPLIQSFGSGFLPKIAAAGYGHVNCQVYMPPPNPGLQTGNYEYSFYPVWRPDNLPHHLDGTRGLTRVQDEDKDEEEVDLELRLGRLL